MLPDFQFLGLDLYYWCLVLGIVLAFAVARIYADRKRVPVKLQNLTFITALIAIFAGYGSAVLFQAVYDFGKTGVFTIGPNTGATFYGGLLGGAAVFFIGYLLVGKKLLGDLPVRYLRDVTGFVACAVVLAHGVGRLGCFSVGCCYGRETDAWFGIYMPAVGAKVIPTQLIEAVFLFILFAVLSVLYFKTKVSCLGVYLTAYAVFRFLIEFARGDDRGAFLGTALSPSQIWATVLFLVGIAVITLFATVGKRKDRSA